MSRFILDPRTVRTRIGKSKLSLQSRRLVLEYLANRVGEDEVILWVDEGWVDLDYAELHTDEVVAMVVFTESFELDEALELRAEQLLGYHVPREGTAFVFLRPVRCTLFTTMPDCVSVFGGGLTVDEIACFAAPDATTLVEKKLKAKVVLSGMGDGAVSIVPGAALQIGAFHSYLSCAATLGEIVAPALAEALEEEAGWEVISNLIDEGPPEDRPSPANAPAGIRGHSFVFTGRLASKAITKKDAEGIVSRNGGKVVSTISDSLDFLVVGDAKSALRGESAPSKKHAQALALNEADASVHIITEEQFYLLKKK